MPKELAASAAASKQTEMFRSRILHAAALALLDSQDEARVAAKAGLALDQSFTIRRYRNGAPSDNPTYLDSQERVYEGMRMAGVPEG